MSNTSVMTAILRGVGLMIKQKRAICKYCGLIYLENDASIEFHNSTEHIKNAKPWKKWKK